ncbi:hypothetical protein B0A50_03174 [Salinomyces thailandicus]|uniref:T6SS Phospholipase effector Tle1-like catalytic domain-containing protein n=1 Tax=Salinomyces thailandicus TaxID=706561 RepID=A0A4U0U3Z7_9PEZI|nr:hypothetical protein B0A50_03174 [Salinomyces thailandica]
MQNDDSPPTEHPDNDSTSKDPSRAPQFPKYIHAVQDANSYRPKGRTIVVALDGTGDSFDADNSNIVELVQCLKKDSPRQITYYQSGIGTYDGGGIKGGFSASMDMSIGSGLGLHVKDAYNFLMQTYKEGDKICLFGFSRGSYTCRCLAGMLHKVGLLPAHNGAQVPFAYKFYKDDSDYGWRMSRDFRKAFCVDVSVYFMGLFDCVASVGLIPRKLPLENSASSSKTGYFRHAMALDEHRAKFKVCRWGQAPKPLRARVKQRMGRGKEGGATEKGEQTTGFTGGEKRDHTSHMPGVMDPYAQTGQGKSDPGKKDTDVEEVWFIGAHADCGGGAVLNDTRHKLSRISLRWMLRQTFQCNTGIIFSAHRLAECGLDINTIFPMCERLPPRPHGGPSPEQMQAYKDGKLGHIKGRSGALQSLGKRRQRREAQDQQQQQQQDAISRRDSDSSDEDFALTGAWTPEQVEDYFDCFAQINDQLAVAKSWWVLECWPIKARVQLEDDPNKWEKKIVMNLGRYRPVQDAEPKKHWTVEQRSEGTGYETKVRMGPGAKWKIVS